MAEISVSLPSTIPNRHLLLHATNLQQLFQHIQHIDDHSFNILLRESAFGIRPKAFVVVFINDVQTLDMRTQLNDGDHVVFETAIAGG